MTLHRRRRLLAAPLVIVVLASAALLPAAPAQADVGVERVSRLAGSVGDPVDLTLGCGFCYPPCHGPLAQPHGSCMPGAKAPPVSFPVSLVPIEKVPKPYRCGPNALCSPGVSHPPAHAPYTLLGKATPPADDENGAGHDVPRYLLSFEIPKLRPGIYAYVIYCDACLRGKGGSLIAAPAARIWRLRVRASDPKATFIEDRR